MFQISTMANFETEVYELLNLFDSSRRYYKTRRRDQQLLFDSPSWSKLTILPWVSWFFNASHGLTTRLPISRFFGKYHSEMLLCWIKTETFTVADFAIVLICQPLQMGRSLRARALGRSAGGAGKWRRACNYVSGISIPPPIPLWLPVDCAVRFPPIGARRNRARM